MSLLIQRRYTVNDYMERLRTAVSAADASLLDLDNEDKDVRMEAILDFASLLTWAKLVVLNA